MIRRRLLGCNRMEASVTSESLALPDLVKLVMEAASDLAWGEQIDLGIRKLEDLALPANRPVLETGPGSLLGSGARCSRVGGLVDLRVYRQRAWACIEVKDNGLRMFPEGRNYAW